MTHPSKTARFVPLALLALWVGFVAQTFIPLSRGEEKQGEASRRIEVLFLGSKNLFNHDPPARFRVLREALGPKAVNITYANSVDALTTENLARYDVLLIADEVICGFGRLGTMFGSERYGLKPDLMTVAKGITSGYAPLSGCIVSEHVWRTIVDEGGKKFGPFGHGYTYTAHPVMAAENPSAASVESTMNKVSSLGWTFAIFATPTTQHHAHTGASSKRNATCMAPLQQVRRGLHVKL